MPGESTTAAFPFPRNLRHGDGRGGGGVARARLHRHRLGRERLSADVDFLEAKGITLTERYRAENIPADAEIVVIGNAI